MEKRARIDGLKAAGGWFLKTAGQVLAHPFAFFRRLPEEPGLAKPLAFLGLMIVLDALYTRILQPLGWLTELSTPGLTLIEEQVIGYIALLFLPLVAFGAARVLGGKGTLVNAVAMIGYASAPLILPSISFLGYVFAAYGIFVYFVGLKETFRLSHRRAFFAFILFCLGLTGIEFGAAYAVVMVWKL